jgi:hypothetical protein
MIGRYSWLIEKPAFLLNSKEVFYVDNAREYLLKDGAAKERLRNPWLQYAVIVHFKNDKGQQTIEVILEKTSGNFLQCSDFLN